MRNVESEEMITVTPRQLEGIIRLSTARARSTHERKGRRRRCRACYIT